MAKTAAKGTTFKIGTTVVGDLTSIGGVALSADTIDVTVLDSEDGYKEYLGSWKDGGEVSLSGFFNHGNAGQAALYDAFESGDATQCVIKFPAGLGCDWTFNGIVTALENGAELEDAVTFDCTIKVTGKPVLATSTT